MPINLLPQELKPKGYTVKLAKTLKKFALISLIIFMVGGAVVFGVILMYTSRMRTSVSRQEELKTQIKALENTEQKLILLRDRIGKINTIENGKNARTGVIILDEVSGLVSEGISPKDVTLNSDLSQVAVYADSLQNLARFMAILSGSGRFKTISLVELRYSPDLGYSAEFGFVK